MVSKKSRKEIACLYGILILASAFALFPIRVGIIHVIKECCERYCLPPEMDPVTHLFGELCKFVD